MVDRLSWSEAMVACEFCKLKNKLMTFKNEQLLFFSEVMNSSRTSWTFYNAVCCEHFTWQTFTYVTWAERYYTAIWTATKRLQSIECKCKIFSQYRKKWFSHFYPECTRSQQDLMLTQVNKLTCMHHWLSWHSEPTKCFVVLTLYTPLPAVFLATQNGSMVSRFLSTVRFMFGYARYCIRSTTISLLNTLSLQKRMTQTTGCSSLKDMDG